MILEKYRGNYIFSKMPLFSSNPKRRTIRKTVGMESSIGYSFSETRWTTTRNKLTFTFLCPNQTEIFQVDFLRKMNKGRKGNLWFPSWKNDLVLTQNIGAADVNLNIEDFDFSTYFPASPGTGSYLWVYVTSGRWFARKIISTTDTVITIESSLGEAVTMSSCKVFGFLFFGRFDIDTFSWQYISPGIAKTAITFIETPLEYPS